MSEPSHRAADEDSLRPRRRMATWAIVAITLSAVVGAMMLFGAGFVAGIALSSAAQSSGALPAGTGVGTESGSGSAPEGGGSTPGEAAASGFDECLVGTWRTTDYVQKSTGPDGESVLTGLNRTFTFDASGRHVVTYDEVTASLTVGEAKASPPSAAWTRPSMLRGTGARHPAAGGVSGSGRCRWDPDRPATGTTAAHCE